MLSTANQKSHPVSESMDPSEFSKANSSSTSALRFGGVEERADSKSKSAKTVNLAAPAGEKKTAAVSVRSNSPMKPARQASATILIKNFFHEPQIDFLYDLLLDVLQKSGLFARHRKGLWDWLPRLQFETAFPPSGSES